jgi:hypothetical protein
MNKDLSLTVGWRLTGHARRAALRRGFSVAEILLAASTPHVRYTSYGYGEGREIRQRDDLAVAVHEPSRTIITVLWHRPIPWTDADVLQARGNCA